MAAVFDVVAEPAGSADSRKKGAAGATAAAGGSGVVGAKGDGQAKANDAEGKEKSTSSRRRGQNCATGCYGGRDTGVATAEGEEREFPSSQLMRREVLVHTACKMPHVLPFQARPTARLLHSHGKCIQVRR
jgi:hypothetical protein